MTLFPWVGVAAVVVGAHALLRAWVADRHATREHEHTLRVLELDVDRERIRAEATRQADEDRIARERHDRELALRDRELAIKEREVALQERIKTPPTPIPEWPADVRALVNSWEDDWAKQDMEKVILTTYGASQDWQAVREALRPWLKTDSPVVIE